MTELYTIAVVVAGAVVLLACLKPVLHFLPLGMFAAVGLLGLCVVAGLAAFDRTEIVEEPNVREYRDGPPQVSYRRRQRQCPDGSVLAKDICVSPEAAQAYASQRLSAAVAAETAAGRVVIKAPERSIALRPFLVAVLIDTEVLSAAGEDYLAGVSGSVAMDERIAISPYMTANLSGPGFDTSLETTKGRWPFKPGYPAFWVWEARSIDMEPGPRAMFLTVEFSSDADGRQDLYRRVFPVEIEIQRTTGQIARARLTSATALLDESAAFVSAASGLLGALGVWGFLRRRGAE